MPATPQDRLYGLTTSVAVKPPVFISADYDITCFGEQTITSKTPTDERTITTTEGMRILLLGQDNPVENGIWVARRSFWVRAPDFNGSRDAVNGTLVFSITGDCWQVEANDPVVIGLSVIHFRPTYPFEANLDIFQRTLRVPEASVSVLPSAEDRAWKGLGFDGAGQPKLQDPAGTGLWGYVPAIGSFEKGSLLTQRFEVLLWESTDEYWRWDGAMPKIVLPGSTPATAGGTGKGKWIDVTDATLRSNLGSSEAGFGADLVQTEIEKTVGDIVRSPYIITGNASIKAPYFNAPREGAEDPEAAAANVAAINRMLDSGAKTVELDDKARQVNSPLIYQGSVGIYGSGRETTSLIWTGGDLPALARPDYTNKEAKGFPNVRVRHLKIVDQALERVSYYTIDLFNGNSSGLSDCWIDCPGRENPDGSMIVTSDRYGVALGIARGSTLKGTNGFVAYLDNCRIVNGTLLINGTDYSVSGDDTQLWGSYRNRAVEISAGGTFCPGIQIVPGAEAGIFLFNDAGYDIDTLKIMGVYFDGSTDVDLFTGWGIKSAAGIGLVSAEILGCNFWHMNQGGLYLAKLYSSTIQSNFRDCDSDDTGEADIKCDDVYGSHIYNRHFRNTAPKKLVGGVEQTRANLGKPYDITAKLGFPISSLGGEASFSNAYARCSVANPTNANSLGGSFLTSFPYGALPNASAMYGKTILVNGKSFYSDGAQWRDISGDATPLSSATNLHLLPFSGKYYAADITIHSNIPEPPVAPSNLTGKANIHYEYASAGYATLTLFSLKASGGVYVQVLEGGSWGAWSKIA